MGSIIYSIATIMIMYGFTSLPEISAIWFLLAGILGILAFIRWEMRTENPVLNPNIFRHNKVFILSNLATLKNYGATYAVTFLLSLYLHYAKWLDPQNNGFVLVAHPVVISIFSPFAGKISDRT
jgi:hypothetical protein